MEKLIFVVWGDGDPERGDELRERLLETTAPALFAAGARGLTIDVHDSAAAEAPSPAPVPADERPHVAVVSVWVDSYDRQGPAIAELLAAAAAPGTVAGYLVTESLYDDYGTTPHASPRSWPDGERSPGVLTVALIHRPPGLDYDEWIHRWHGTQSPESARLQPRTRYVRNEVVRPVTAGAPDVDGIVEEGWPSAEHVRDQMLFFNATTKDELRANVEQMLANVSECLDLGRLRSATMSEHLVRTVGGPR